MTTNVSPNASNTHDLRTPPSTHSPKITEPPHTIPTLHRLSIRQSRSQILYIREPPLGLGLTSPIPTPKLSQGEFPDRAVEGDDDLAWFSFESDDDGVRERGRGEGRVRSDIGDRQIRIPIRRIRRGEDCGDATRTLHTSHQPPRPNPPHTKTRLTMIHQSQTPVIRNRRRIPLITFIARLSDDIVVEREFVVGGYDEVGGDVPDLEKGHE